jgi:alanyl-tRNA synthetase
MVDQGESVHPNCPGIGLCDCDRYLEIWNLVFMQYNRTDTDLIPLPNPSIDTGMGLERITAICQGVTSNYETDLFQPIFSAISLRINRSLGETIALMPARVVSDHLRAMTFLIGDGVLPSNEGRGYVLRRIIRRAARFSTKLTLNCRRTPCEGGEGLCDLTGSVIDTMRQVYPELQQHRDQIKQIVRI